MVLARMVAKKLAKFVSASRLRFLAVQPRGKGSRSRLELADKVAGCWGRSQETLQMNWSLLEVKHQEGSRGQSVR